MSTKFYGYRIAKADWPAFTTAVRRFYAAEHPELKATRVVATQLAELNKTDELVDLMMKLSAHVASERGREGGELCMLQVFDAADLPAALTSGPQDYIFRVLERGWLFMNSFADAGWPLEPVWFDTRSEQSEAQRANGPLVDAIDELIRTNRYLLYPVLEYDALPGVVLETKRTARKRVEADS